MKICFHDKTWDHRNGDHFVVVWKAKSRCKDIKTYIGAVSPKKMTGGVLVNNWTILTSALDTPTLRDVSFAPPRRDFQKHIDPTAPRRQITSPHPSLTSISFLKPAQTPRFPTVASRVHLLRVDDNENDHCRWVSSFSTTKSCWVLICGLIYEFWTEYFWFSSPFCSVILRLRGVLLSRLASRLLPSASATTSIAGEFGHFPSLKVIGFCFVDWLMSFEPNICSFRPHLVVFFFPIWPASSTSDAPKVSFTYPSFCILSLCSFFIVHYMYVID